MKTKTKKFKDIKVGDRVIGSDGKPKYVTAVYDEHMPSEMFEIDFGEFKTKASGNHLWYSETKEDKANKDTYMQMAQNYFATEQIPDIDDNTAFPIEIIASKFARTKESQGFIMRVCESMGHSVETPEVFFDGYMDLKGERMIKRYSSRSLKEFLNKMKKAVVDGDSYFYFGKVRTTLELLEFDEVNIPTVKEVSGGDIS